MPRYNEFFYNEFIYEESSLDAPIDLRFYRTDTDGRYVFYWTFNTDFLTPNLVPSLLNVIDNNNQLVRDLNGEIVQAFGDITPYDFELQIDDTPTFSSPTSYFSSTAINYQNGVLVKGYEIAVPSRLDKQEQIMYARVRTKFGETSFSTFSDSIQFTIFPKFTLDYNEKLLDALPDEHVYNKDVLKQPILSRNTVIYSLVYGMYADNMDKFKLQELLLKTDIFVDLVRDEQLFDNFGFFFDFDKPLDLQPVEYRTVVRALINAALTGSTLQAINYILVSFTGVRPLITLIRNLDEGFEGDSYLEDIGQLDDNSIFTTRSNGELAHGFEIEILNPTLRELDIDLIKNLLSKVIAAHTRITFTQ